MGGAGGQGGSGGEGGTAGAGGAGGSGGGAACPIAEKLVGQWRGESNAKDSSGVADGVWTGTEQYADGRLGKAFLFDGSSYVLAPVDYTGPLTVDLWVKATDAVPALFSSALSTGPMAAAPYFQFDSDGAGNYRVLLMNTGALGAVSNSSFKHLAITYDGGKITTYYEGLPAGSIDNVAAAGFKQLRLGINRGGDVTFKGAVDEVHVWKRALAADEIAQLHATPRADICAAPACGDTNVDMGESCDDGNTQMGDGCTVDCKKECSAIAFDGSFVGIADNPSVLNVSSVTFAAWYKAAVGTSGAIAAKRGNTPGGHFTYSLTVTGGGLATRLQTNVNLDFLDLAHPPAIPDGLWHHAAVSYDAATGKGILYLDGKEVANGTKGTGLVAADPMQPFTVGGTTLNGTPNNLLNSDIANVIIYNTALSAADIANLAVGKYAPGPLLFYPTLEAMGTTASDASGNNHLLTLGKANWATTGPFCTP